MDDRISELPEPLKEKILFASPTKDAIRMSLSSKHWQSIWDSAWKSRITCIDLDDDSDSTHDSFFIRKNPREIGHFWVGESVSEHMTFTDLDHYLKKVITHKRHNRRYKSPAAIFDVVSLLDVVYCNLDIALLVEKNTIFFRLRMLRLSGTDLNKGGGIGELVSRCPLLESLSLKYCGNLEHVDLRHALNLKDVEVERSVYDVPPKMFKIDAPNLESIVYEDRTWGRRMEIRNVFGRNLKKLHIFHRNSTINNRYIDEILDKFPLLEDLALHACYFQPPRGDVLRISSRSLTVLEMEGETKARNIVVDAPNLVSFDHEDRKVFNRDRFSRSVSFNSVKLEKHILRIHENHLDTTCFLNLRTYLCKYSPWLSEISEISLDATKLLSVIPIDLQTIEIPPWPKVIRKLSLSGFPYDLADMEHLISGILWSCQPREMRVTLPSNKNNKFIKVIYEMLRDEGGRENYSWRRYLRSVMVKSFWIMKDGKQHCCDADTNSTMDLTRHFKVAYEATFALQWFDELH